jgi:hypothetical protein
MINRKIMKIISIVIIIIISSSLHVTACDYCNCYMGLNPHYKKNSIGLRYHLLNYSGTHMSKDELQELNLSESDISEMRTSAELHVQWYPFQKLQILFSVPYIVNSETFGQTDEHSSTTEINKGISDPTLLALYQIFNRNDESATGYSQRLFAGGGLKFPLGKYKLDAYGEAAERVHLPGSGSLDFIVSTTYLGKIGKTGFNLNASYAITNQNSQEFKFGNRFNTNLTAYYELKINQAQIFPSVGIYFENALQDKDDGSVVYNSGGTILYAHAGADLYYKKFSITVAFDLPVSQKLNMPQPQLKYKLITGISYAFN